jgi:hypothetical protein
MATLDDILTCQKNGVVAINNLGLTLKSYNEGQYTSVTVSVPTVIVTGSGRFVSVTIVDAGSTTGYVYNALLTTNVATSNALISLPPSAIGVYPVGAKFNTGLVVVPGTGQTVNVTYSLDA